MRENGAIRKAARSERGLAAQKLDPNHIAHNGQREHRSQKLSNLQEQETARRLAMVEHRAR